MDVGGFHSTRLWPVSARKRESNVMGDRACFEPRDGRKQLASLEAILEEETIPEEPLPIAKPAARFSRFSHRRGSMMDSIPESLEETKDTARPTAPKRSLPHQAGRRSTVTFPMGDGPALPTLPPRAVSVSHTLRRDSRLDDDALWAHVDGLQRASTMFKKTPNSSADTSLGGNRPVLHRVLETTSRPVSKSGPSQVLNSPVEQVQHKASKAHYGCMSPVSAWLASWNAPPKPALHAHDEPIDNETLLAADAAKKPVFSPFLNANSDHSLSPEAMLADYRRYKQAIKAAGKAND